MSFFMHVRKEELKSLQKIIPQRKKELLSHIQGSLQIKKISNQDYLYLVFRKGKKVKSKYLGKFDPLLKEKIEHQILLRKELEQDINKKMQELKEYKKVIRAKRD